MATGPSWLVLKIRLTKHDSEWIKDILTGAKTVGSTLSYGMTARRTVVGISRLLVGMVSGAYTGKIWASVANDGGSYGTAQIACTQANAAGNYVRWTFGTLTITLTEGTDFARGATNTTCGDNLAAAINAHPVLKGLYTAADVTGTITLTAKVPGKYLENVSMSTDDATAFGLTQQTGGTWGTAKIFPQQIWMNRTL